MSVTLLHDANSLGQPLHFKLGAQIKGLELYFPVIINTELKFFYERLLDEHKCSIPSKRLLGDQSKVKPTTSHSTAAIK